MVEARSPIDHKTICVKIKRSDLDFYPTGEIKEDRFRETRALRTWKAKNPHIIENASHTRIVPHLIESNIWVQIFFKESSNRDAALEVL
jgi:hypothetical protein